MMTRLQNFLYNQRDSEKWRLVAVAGTKGLFAPLRYERWAVFEGTKRRALDGVPSGWNGKKAV